MSHRSAPIAVRCACAIVALAVGTSRAAADAPVQVVALASKADLVLEVPQAEPGGKFSFTVKNTGGSDAHSSKLKVTCEALYPPPAHGCAVSTQTIDVPPLGKNGGVFKSAVITVVDSAVAAKAAGPPWFRVKVTAEADSEGQVIESEKRNNWQVLTFENFQGTQPLQAAPPKGSLTGDVGAPGIDGSKLQLAPKMSLETETKLDTATSNWLLARNRGLGDFVGGRAQFISCRVYHPNGQPVSTFCSFYPPLTLPIFPVVPPVKAGAFASLFKIPKAKANLPPGMYFEIEYRLQGGGVDQYFKISSK